VRVPAITVRQPWATLLACGIKRYETRSWATRYRGPIAIHASARMQPEDRIWVQEDPDVLQLVGRHTGDWSDGQWPLGVVLAVGRLVDCEETDGLFVRGLERRLGDFSPGRYAWRLEGVVRLPEPVPARGSLGLWMCELPLRYPEGG